VITIWSVVRSVVGALDATLTEIFERNTRRLTSCQTTVRQINCELWTCCSIFLWSAASQLHNVCGYVAISQFTVRRRGCYLWQLLMIASSDRRGRIQGGKTAAERQRRSRRMSWSCCCWGRGAGGGAVVVSITLSRDIIIVVRGERGESEGRKFPAKIQIQ